MLETRPMQPGVAEPHSCPVCHQEAARAAQAAEVSYLARNPVVPHLGRAVHQSHSYLQCPIKFL